MSTGASSGRRPVLSSDGSGTVRLSLYSTPPRPKAMVAGSTGSVGPATVYQHLHRVPGARVPGHYNHRRTPILHEHGHRVPTPSPPPHKLGDSATVTLTTQTGPPEPLLPPPAPPHWRHCLYCRRRGWLGLVEPDGHDPV